MLVLLDSDKSSKALNTVKVILDDGRHVTVTPEGIIVDIVRAGKIVQTTSFSHEDLLVTDRGASNKVSEPMKPIKLKPKVKGPGGQARRDHMVPILEALRDVTERLSFLEQQILEGRDEEAGLSTEDRDILTAVLIAIRSGAPREEFQRLLSRMRS